MAKSNPTPRGRQAAAAAPAAAKPEGAKALKVIPKKAGFRRAGYAFPDGETLIPLADLTDLQFQQLTTEPMLLTVVVDAEAAADSAEADA